MYIVIRYKDSSGLLSEREISDIEYDQNDIFIAYCHLRNENRSFRLSRIEIAFDRDTGEVIDLYTKLGLQCPISKQVKPVHTVPLTPEEAKLRRNKEKYELYKPFVYRLLAEQAKAKLFDLFENRCFKCGTTYQLVIDHHIPQAVGGKLVSGNLVALCRACNGKKHALLPESFYSLEALETLMTLFAKQAEIFNFQFNWDKWRGDRKAYLLELGIPAETVTAVLTDKNHPRYVGTTEQDMGHALKLGITFGSID